MTTTVLRCPFCQGLLHFRAVLRLQEDDDRLKEELLNIGMSTRCWNSVTKANIVTIGDLAEKTEHDLLCIKNCGRKTVAELKAILAARGLSLREEQ